DGAYGIAPKRTLAACRGPLDTLIVAGGTGVAEAERDYTLIRWIRSAASRSRRVCSVCTGAFLLARAGLLEGRRATTHWSGCDELRRRYPGTVVDGEPIFVRDGEVWTSAGVTAGMDLALALVEARRRLESGTEPIETVASRAGFGTPETMRRAFARRVGVAPAEYRARFRRAPEPVA